MVSMDLPLFEVCRMLIISLMGPMEWLWSNKWVAKLDFLTLYLKYEYAVNLSYILTQTVMYFNNSADPYRKWKNCVIECAVNLLIF